MHKQANCYLNCKIIYKHQNTTLILIS